MIVKTAHSHAPDARAAADELSTQLPSSRKAIILFASPTYDLRTLVDTLARPSRGSILIGCSSAGEFSERSCSEHSVSALTLDGDDVSLQAAMETGIKADQAAAGRRLARQVATPAVLERPHKVALVLANALAGYTEALVGGLYTELGPTWRFFGGGAGDDARFERSFVFCGDRVLEDSAVVLAIGSEKPLGLSYRHDWACASATMRVTAADGIYLKALDGAPAVEAVKSFAGKSGQKLDLAHPVPFFLHNVLGIQSPSDYRLRVPLSIEADGAIRCASDVPEGSIVCFMRPPRQAASAARDAAADALSQIEGHEVAAALLFDCAATRLRLGIEFEDALAQFSGALCAPYAGCNTYGQVASSPKANAGFHNCTAVVCVFPK